GFGAEAQEPRRGATPEEWTKIELKQRIPDLIQTGEMVEIKNVKEKSPMPTAVTELSKHSRRKAELIQYVTNEYNIVPTSNDTIGTIQRKAMAAILNNTTPTGADQMGFGKFSARTYQSVLEEEIIEKTRVMAKAKERLRATPKKGYAAATPSAAPSGTAGSADVNLDAVANLTNLVAHLVQEVQTLKEERSEKPRKQFAKDVDMPNPKDTECPRQAPNAQHCLHYLQEGWVQYFGYPKCLRFDPAGAFRSQAVEDWCDRHSVFLDIVPGEPDWKIGACENAVHGVKEVMQKLCQYAPDETGRYLSASQGLPPDLLCENSQGEFAGPSTYEVQELVEVQPRAATAWLTLHWNGSDQSTSSCDNSEHLKWGDWEEGKLTQCGVVNEQTVTRSCLDTMIRANTLLAHAKLKQNFKMKIHALPSDSNVMFVAWVDAASGNRIDGGSTQGIFVGATTENIMQGDVCDVSPVSWHSQ
ncbi:unnamed protein product, partial [Symbiodinium sp. CCMP2592]